MHWRVLFGFLFTRVKSPLSHPTFFLYFVGAVIGAGSLGLWVTLISQKLRGAWDLSQTINALYTYFPAVAFVSALELNLIHNLPRSVRVLSFVACGLIGALAVLCGFLSPQTSALWLGIAGSVAAVALWWFANAENENLRDTPSENALGGDPHAKPAGSNSEFKL
jgi:hypothetical protein